MKNALNLISFLIIISALAALVWYSPVMFKGYSPMELWKSSLLARNLSQEGFFGAENSLNVFLASSLVEEEGQISTESNRLAPIVISQIFKITGLPSYNNLIFISIGILVLALIIFTIAVYYLFNLKTAALFSFIYILLPFNWWYAAYNFGVYEVALLFLSIFFLLFFVGFKSDFRYKYILMSLAGIFLALAGIAREAFLIAAPILLIYLLLKKEKKFLFYLFIPFFIILSLFWLPAMISGENSYYSSYFKGQSEETSFLSWDFLAHLYPDPYTYHFEREEYLDNYYLYLSSSDVGFLDRTLLVKRALGAGIEVPSFFDRIRLSNAFFARHVFRFLAIEEIGGPLIFFMLILGFAYLKRRRKDLFALFSFWIIFSLLVFSLALMRRSHLIDFGWIIALLVSLGLIFFNNILSKRFEMKEKTRVIVSVLLVVLVLYNLVLSNHVLWGRIYDQPHHLKMLAYAREIKGTGINDRDVIAIGLDEFKINRLNYQVDKSMVVFSSQTIKRLIEKEELQSAFDKFNVKYVLGYSPKLTKQILDNSKAKNIASDDVKSFLPETSQAKSWFLNLIR